MMRGTKKAKDQIKLTIQSVEAVREVSLLGKKKQIVLHYTQEGIGHGHQA
jgi:hypothetical protein